MNFHALFSPRLLIPLTLLTPYVFVLHYGISLVELVIWTYIVLVLLPTVTKTEFLLPRFLLIFLLLYTTGYLGALINGMSWQVPIGVWNLNYFYKLLIGIGAFCIGMRYRGEIYDIFKSNLFFVTIVVLGLIAVVYPFLPLETKVKYFAVFYPPDSGYERYLTSQRLPGLGLNANIYSFMIFSYLLLSFRAFLDKKIGFIVPLVSFLVILVLSSKLVIVLAVAACAVQAMNNAFRFNVSPVTRDIRVFVRNRGFAICAFLFLAVVVIVLIATQTAAGKRVVDSYATVQRFEAALASNSDVEEPKGLALRIKYWKKGLERAQLAPVLGIGKDPFRRMSNSLVGFYNPHNEYLRMWLLYGFSGLLAWVYLLSYLSYKNFKSRTDFEWLIFYAAMALFLMFDGGLDDPRVTVYLFLMLGINWGQVRRAKAHALRQQQPLQKSQAIGATIRAAS